MEEGREGGRYDIIHLNNCSKIVFNDSKFLLPVV